MSITHRVKRTLATAAAGAMILSLMPVGAVSADEHDGPCDGVPETVFADGEFIADVFEETVQCMAAYGITIGVDDVPNFAPGDNVSRQQMALFIARLATQAQNGDTAIPDAPTAPFEDLEVGVPDAQRAAIDFIYDLDITTGVTPTTYGPGMDVTREEMATFIFRAHDALGVLDELETPDTPTVEFPDIDDAEDVHKPAIEALTALGIIQGQDDGNFNPKGPINRQQMSQFISVSIGIIDSVGLWNGAFVGVDPDPEPPVETPDPEFTLEVAADPETPDDDTAVTFTSTLAVDVEDESVEDYYSALAIFAEDFDGDVIVDGEVNVEDAAAFLEGDTDANGVAELVAEDGLPIGTHTLLGWAAEDETTNPDDAVAIFEGDITVTDSTAIDATFTVVGLDAGEDSLLLSTGEALVVFEYDTDDDRFFVEGNPSSFAVFANELGSIGTDLVEIEVEGNAEDRFDHNLVISDHEGGVVGDVDVAANTFVITDFPSGIELSGAFDWDQGDDEIFQLNGTAVSQAAFENNISVGDLIEITGYEDGDVDTVFNLINNAPTGTPAYTASIGVDVLGDEDFDVVDAATWDVADMEIPGHVFAEVNETADAYTVTLNGDEVAEIVDNDEAAPITYDLTDWDNIVLFVQAVLDDTEFVDGDDVFVLNDLEVTYDRTAGDVTIDATAEVEIIEDPEFAPFEGMALSEDGGFNQFVVDVDGDEVEVNVDGDTTFRIEGVNQVRGDFNDAVTLGDTIQCVEGELTDDTFSVVDGGADCSVVNLIPGDFEGQVTEADGSAEFTVELATEYVIDDFDTEISVVDPLGYVGDTVLFSVNGDPTDDGVDGDAWTAGDVLAMLDNTNLDVSDVSISLEPGDDEFTWAFTGIPQSVIDGVLGS